MTVPGTRIPVPFYMAQGTFHKCLPNSQFEFDKTVNLWADISQGNVVVTYDNNTIKVIYTKDQAGFCSALLSILEYSVSIALDLISREGQVPIQRYQKWRSALLDLDSPDEDVIGFNVAHWKQSIVELFDNFQTALVEVEEEDAWLQRFQLAFDQIGKCAFAIKVAHEFGGIALMMESEVELAKAMELYCYTGHDVPDGSYLEKRMFAILNKADKE